MSSATSHNYFAVNCHRMLCSVCTADTHKGIWYQLTTYKPPGERAGHKYQRFYRAIVPTFTVQYMGPQCPWAAMALKKRSNSTIWEAKGEMQRVQGTSEDDFLSQYFAQTLILHKVIFGQKIWVLYSVKTGVVQFQILSWNWQSTSPRTPWVLGFCKHKMILLIQYTDTDSIQWAAKEWSQPGYEGQNQIFSAEHSANMLTCVCNSRFCFSGKY